MAIARTRRRTTLLGELVQLQAELALVPGEEAMLELLCRRLATMTGADAAAILMPVPAGLRYRAAHGLAERHLGRTIGLDTRAGRCYTSGAAVPSGEVGTDPRADPDPNQELELELGTGSSVIELLRADTGVLGAVKLDAADPNAFDDDDAAALALLAGFAGQLIARSRQRAEEADRDRSLRSLLRESQERLAALVTAAPLTVYGFDRAGIVTLSIGRGLESLGLAPNQHVGASADSVFGETPALVLAVGRALAGEETTVEAPFRGRDLEWRLMPVLDHRGRPDGLLAVATDIGDRVQAEMAQRESDAKSRLMAMMNHEVRTPLNSILGFAELLGVERAGPLNDKQSRYVANIEAAGRHLLALVNDSLDLAKLASGQMVVNSADLELAAVLEQSASQLQPLIEARGLELRLDARPAYVRADRRRLVQVIWNLLSNACKYTPTGGAVTLSGRTREGLVTISVADTGPGISPADQERIFDEFYQVPDRPNPEGTGLGLPLSRQLVELMEGTLTVASEVGAGTTFTIALPAGRAVWPGGGRPY